MRKIYLLIFVFVSYFTIAQNRQMPINIQSPNAASLGKYGDLSMDFNTGRANVSVPLYQLEEGGVPMDISMSYDTGGVRVNEVPGWVGQNWTLQAGGIVTRAVRGKSADEMYWNLNSYGYAYDNKGYYYYKDILNTSDWNSQQHLSDLATNALHYPDYEPDIFTFNFMGYSGKFYLGSDGEWKVSSPNNLKVVIDINDKVQPNNYYYVAYGNFNNIPFPKVLGKITIIDDKGNKFIFGDTTNQNSIEFTFQNFFNQITTAMTSSAWYLTKVYNKYNQLVYDLDYDRGDYIASFYDRNGFQKLTLTTNSWIGGGCSYGVSDGDNVYANGNLIIPSYLKKISTYSSKQILFNSTTSNSLKYGANDSPIIQTYDKFRQDIQATQPELWNQLDDSYFYYIRRDQNLNVLPNMTDGNLHIYAYLNALKWRKLVSLAILSSDQKSIFSASFNYNDNPNSRLRLDNIKINNEDYNNNNIYSFEYNNFDSLPLFTSKNIDHFGYYKSTPFVLNSDNPSVHEPSRATDLNTVAYGTLSKITYPTKGYTKFFYEPHTFSQYVGNDLNLKTENGIIGGVRIRSMFDYDGNGIPKPRNFYYVTDLQSNQSSGILLQKNNYFMADYKMPTLANGVTLYQTYFSISPIVYLSNLMGSPIEYSNVIEDNGKGKIVNKYSSYADYPDFKNDVFIAQDRNKFDPHTEYAYKRGKIKQRQYFDGLGSKIRQEDYVYQDFNNQNVRGFSYTSIPPCSGVSNAAVINGMSYNIYFSDFEPISKKTINYYSGGGSIEENENYNYIKNNNFGDNFLISKTTSNPDNTINEQLVYPFQMSGQIYTTLSERHDFPVLNKETYLNSKIIAKEQSNYDYMPIVDQSSTLLAPSSQKKINVNTNEEYGGISYDLYDNIGNILQYTPQNSIPVSLVWGYNKTRIIAKVEGATYSQIKSYITDIVDNSNQAMTNSNYNNDDLISKLNDFRNNTNLKDFQITTYTYYRGGIGLKSVTNPSGQIEKYVYDIRNRLQKILDKDNNVIKEWDYNYSSTTIPTIFLNSQKTQTFTRNNCGANYQGGTYTYTVPEGKYSSLISQNDVDQQAQNEINVNGQNTANANASCTPIIDCGYIYEPFLQNNILSSNVKMISNNVNVSIAISPLNINNNWLNPVLIGRVANPNCRPSSVITSTYTLSTVQSWKYTTSPNGNITVQLTNGTVNNTQSVPPIPVYYNYTK